MVGSHGVYDGVTVFFPVNVVDDDFRLAVQFVAHGRGARLDSSTLLTRRRAR